jgi:hypothetical protein
MTKQAFTNQLDMYEEREKARRQDFIERMEQKWRVKVWSQQHQAKATDS